MPEEATPPVHYLPPREDGRDAGTSPAFTTTPELVTCPTCLERLARAEVNPDE